MTEQQIQNVFAVLAQILADRYNVEVTSVEVWRRQEEKTA